MDTIEKKMTLKKRFLAFFASMAVLAGGVVAGVQADTTETGTVQIDVVDVNGAPVVGAKLQIMDANNSVRADFESNGQTQEFTLEAGSYTLHELVAPDGYEVAEDVPFEVVASETVHTEIKQNAPPATENADTTPAEENKAETRSAPEPKDQGALSAVYVGGANANDDNNGSKESPVKTWDKAKELATSDGTIYVAGTLDVSGDISAQQVVTRAKGFTSGNMFNVTDSANFTNIHIKGNGETVGNSVIAFEHKGAGKSLVVGQGVTIENFVSTGEGAAVYVSDAAGASVTFNGAKFLNNQALNGGAVAIRTAKGNANAKGFKVNVTGGTLFDGNVAKQTDDGTGQGGAIFLNGQFVTNIDSATFKNNKAQYGAAIVNYNEYIGNEINIVNGLVANNKTGNGTPSHYLLKRSGQSAGGVNICMSGAAEVNISSEKGVAIFDNAGPKGDIAVWDNSDPSKLKVNEGAMLGGGNHNWQPVGARGYKAAPSAAEKAAARASATVVFENNESTYHGTIMSNSLVQFGTKLAELRIKKIDAVSNKAMAGVVFKLTSESGNVRTATTFIEPPDEGHGANYQDNHDGVASFTNLPDGKYTLEEVTPAGYRGTMPWTVTIQNQQVTIKDNGQGLIQPVDDKYYNFVVRNQPMTVKISKQALGDDTKELPGAQIKVTGPNGFVKEWTSTDKPNEFKVEPGDYTLEEVSAPDGFNKITTIVKFTIDEYGQVTVTNATEVLDDEVIVKDVNHLILTDMPTPEVTTDAKDAADGDKYVEAADKASVTDVVTYKGLRPGKEYTVTGTLHKKVNGESAGVIATKTVKFTPTEANGTIEITFEFDASELAGETLVAFESIKRNNVEVASHADIDDGAQTVRVVKILTAATGKIGKVVFADEELEVTDTVFYTGLEGGKTYTLKGTLVKKSDASSVATSKTTFTADLDGTGTTTMTFTFDASKLGGDSVVAYEHLYAGDVTDKDVSEDSDEYVTKHEDINDESQTVEVKKPEVETNASDATDGDKYLDVADDVVINDVVTFTGLIPGKEYTLDGTLNVKKVFDGEVTPATQKVLIPKSVKAVASEGATIVDADARTFVADKADGSVTLAFTVDATDIAGEQVVVFESLKYLGKEIAAHANINDKNQTVYFPQVGTVATSDDVTDNKSITIHYTETKTVTITDTIEYAGLTPGAKYTVKGQLVAKTDEQPVIAENADVFTASDTGAGEWKLTFTFEANRQVLDGIAELVVFEYVFEDDVRAKDIDLSKAEEDDSFVAKHEDIKDESQTIRVQFTYPTPELIGTVATDDADGDKVVAVDSDVTVKDVVKFEGLAIGRTYTLKAKLVVKGTGGKTVVAEAEKSFVADVEDGTTDMFFTFNTAGLEGESLVAYEYLLEGDMVGQDVDLDIVPDPLKHADDNDADQTVTVEKKKTPPPTPPSERARVKLPITGLPRTGESVALAGMVALMLLGGGLVLMRRRND